MMFLFHEASAGYRASLSPGCCECQQQAVRKYSSSPRDNDNAQESLEALQGLLQVLENVKILVPDLLPAPERGNKFPLSSYHAHLIEAPRGTLMNILLSTRIREFFSVQIHIYLQNNKCSLYMREVLSKLVHPVIMLRNELNRI